MLSGNNDVRKYRKPKHSYREGFVYSIPNTMISSSNARNSASIKPWGETDPFGPAAW